jgi:hypothetical protein
MKNQWSTKSRFGSGQEWIRASLINRGVDKNIDPDELEQFVNDVGQITKKQKGLFSVLKNPPKDIDRALTWHAHHLARHFVQWRDFAPWTDRVTMLLMRSSDEQKERVEKQFDLFKRVYMVAAHLQKEGK